MANHVTPSWLNNSFLVEVLQSVEENKQVEVLKWKSESVVPPGSNYMSCLYRVTVEYKAGQNKTHSTSFIVKAPLEPGIMREFADQKGLYGRELRMYKEVLPKMYSLHNWRMSPKTFACSLDDFLVLEDLKLQGYQMADRVKQLDVAHSRLFFLTLARLHAMSVAVHHSHPDLIEAVGQQESFSDKEEEQCKLFLNAMLHTMRKLPECEQYIEMVSNKIDTLYKELKQIYKPTEGINVLNHGDTWTNNILFKYSDNGEVLDCKLVDFQVSMYCSFAHDIIYFWITSANKEVRENHREEMFELYRNTLNKSLEELRCSERLIKVEFERQMKAFAPFSLHVITIMLSIIFADPNDLVDFNDIKEDEFSIFEDFESHVYKNFRSKRYTEVLPDLLKEVKLLGAFD